MVKPEAVAKSASGKKGSPVSKPPRLASFERVYGSRVSLTDTTLKKATVITSAGITESKFLKRG